MIRQEDTFTGYYSEDGVQFTSMDQIDMLGRVVTRENFVKETPQFNYMLLLDKLPVGFYILTVRNG